MVKLCPALKIQRVCNNDIDIAHSVQYETQDDAVSIPDIEEDASNSVSIEYNNNSTSMLNTLLRVIEIEEISKIQVRY